MSWTRVVLITAAAATASGHVGTTNTYFDGRAGPYGIRVVVRLPGVIPGLAQISVRITEGADVERVTVRPLRWDAGLDGAPPPDTARMVAGEPDLYAAELWLMTAGSYSVHVSVDGAAGSGTAFVPVLAVAQTRLTMNTPMAVALLAAGVFLFVGAITVFGAAVRESVLPPGTSPTPTHHRRARWAMSVGGLALAVLLFGGWRWWGAVDQAYRNRLFRPMHISTAVDAAAGGRVLSLEIDDETWRDRRWSPLIPDHGKLMHLFVVRDGELNGFAHLHPVALDSSRFTVPLPSGLPAGDYRIYGDVVHESGFAQTLTDTLGVPPARAAEEPRVADPDDSWVVTPPYGAAAETTHRLASGRIMEWQRGPDPVVTDREVSLRFVVRERDGNTASLEPYMGMLSHAVVTRTDGSVFVHLHPVGTISLAAQRRFEMAESSGPPEHPPSHAGRQDATTVTFPFEFSTAGDYRLWVQVKIAGQVETGVFDVTVHDAP